MKDKDFEKLQIFSVVNGVLIPQNNNANKLVVLENNNDVYFLSVKQRDLKLHACYFVFCNWLWQKMPNKFKLERCSNPKDMYKYLKLIQGKYKVSMAFKGIEVIEFESISFGNMTDEQFKEFVNEQISYLYSEMLVPMKMEQLYEEANEEFKSLFKKLI